MKDDTVKPVSTHLGTIAEKIDGICDDFECRWRNGERPMIEWYLGRMELNNQPRLLGELIGIELFWRRRHSEEPTLEAYLRRFPGRDAVVVREFKRDSDVVLAEATGSLAQGSQAGETSANRRTVAPRQSLDASTSRARPEVSFPRSFGDYELLAEIGHGGMGVVYRARQRAADRIVALKVIRHDRLDRLPEHSQHSAMSRFRDEAQAAARLQHDNLVTVFDVGEVDGQPYFSMQLIEGENVAEMLTVSPLDPRRAAGYLQQVACALAEAHAHKILHRDLKPHNILIDAKTDRPLVTDFGLAKFQSRQPSETSAGQVMGTPQYMAPEQARDSSQVQAASDIYSLGATLYHMLVGRPPFQAATALETLRQVVDDSPAAPRELNPAIPRDLETICLKCLEKEPAQRYRSAQALADDLARFLAGETILARPASRLSRLARWCRRNQAVATLAAIAAFCLVALLIVLFEANRRGRQSLAQVVAAKDESDASFRQARQAVDRLLTHVSDNTLLNQPGLQPLRKELLVEALAYYKQFVERDGSPLVNDELALLHFRIGRITAEVQSPHESLAWFERALKLQRQLRVDHASRAERLEALGDTLNFYGQALVKVGRIDAAQDALSESLQFRTQLAEDQAKGVDQSDVNQERQRKLANVHMNLGQVFVRQRRYLPAQKEFQVAQRIRSSLLDRAPDDYAVKTDCAMGYFNSANLAIAMQHGDAAQASLDKATFHFAQLVATKPELLQNQYRLAMCYRVAADLAMTRQNDSEAAALYAQADDLLQVLTRLNPHVHEYRAALAGLSLSRAALLQQDEQFTAASRELRLAVSSYDELVQHNPDVPAYQYDLAASQLRQGVVFAALDAQENAREALAAAESTAAALVKRFPENQDYAGLQQAIETEIAALDSHDKAKPSTIPGPPEP